MANGRVFYNDQIFYLNAYKLSGVQSLGFTFSNSYKEVNVLGVGLIRNYFESLPTIDLNFNRIFVSSDPVYDIFINSLEEEFPSLTGIFLYKDKHIKFENDAYIKSYNLSCSLNQYVTNSVSLSNISNYITGYNTSGFYNYLSGTHNGSEDLKIPTYQSVYITTNPIINDRIVSFNYSLDVEKEPVYRLGDLKPYAFKTQYPLSEKITLEVEIDEDSIPEYNKNLCKFQSHDVEIIISTKCGGEEIRRISRTGMVLEALNLDASIGSNLKMSLTYANAINKVDIFPQTSPFSFSAKIITGENAKYVPLELSQSLNSGIKVFEYCIPDYTGVLLHSLRQLNSGIYDG